MKGCSLFHKIGKVSGAMAYIPDTGAKEKSKLEVFFEKKRKKIRKVEKNPSQFLKNVALEFSYGIGEINHTWKVANVGCR